MIAVLSDGHAYTVSEIVVRMKMAQPAVSKHLRILLKGNVVTVSKRGRFRMYRLNAERLKPIRDWVRVFESHWTHQVDHVKKCAERKALARMVRLDEDTNEQQD